MMLEQLGGLQSAAASASSCSRVSRATFVSLRAADELRGCRGLRRNVTFARSPSCDVALLPVGRLLWSAFALPPLGSEQRHLAS